MGVLGPENSNRHLDMYTVRFWDILFFEWCVRERIEGRMS